MPIQTATFAVQMKIRLGKSRLGGRREHCERVNGEGGRKRERERERERERNEEETTGKGKRGNGRKEPEMDYAQQRESKGR